MADRIAATFNTMADDLAKAFQPIEGFVLDHDGDRVYLDIGQEAGAQVGQEFTVFRKGEPFYHPVTGKVLGRLRGHPRLRAGPSRAAASCRGGLHPDSRPPRAAAPTTACESAGGGSESPSRPSSTSRPRTPTCGECRISSRRCSNGPSGSRSSIRFSSSDTIVDSERPRRGDPGPPRARDPPRPDARRFRVAGADPHPARGRRPTSIRPGCPRSPARRSSRGATRCRPSTPAEEQRFPWEPLSED